MPGSERPGVTYAGEYAPIVVASAAPQIVSAPAVSGTPAVGALLSCSTGTWTDMGSTFTYQWQRAAAGGGSAIPATPTLDDTNRLDEPVLSLNGAWGSGPLMYLDNPAQLLNTEIVSTVAAQWASAFWAQQFTPDQEVWITTGTDSDAGWTYAVLLRCSNPGQSTFTGYLVTFTKFDTATVYKVAGNTPTQIGQITTLALQDNALFGARIVGNTIHVLVGAGDDYLSGIATDVYQVVDATYATGGFLGVRAYGLDRGPTRFGGGSYVDTTAWANIPGATNTNYTPVGGDAGYAIRCVVTAVNSVGSNSAVSNAIGPVVSGVPGGSGKGEGRIHYSYSTRGVTNYASATAAQQQWARDHWDSIGWAHADFWNDYRTNNAVSWNNPSSEYIDGYAIYHYPNSNDYSLPPEFPQWVLKDGPNGNYLYIPYACSGGVCSQFAADIGDPAWWSHYGDDVQADINKGYAGIFMDDVDFYLNVGNGNGTHVAPWDKRLGRYMTNDDWNSYYADFITYIRNRFPNITLTLNIPFGTGPNHDLADANIQRAILHCDFVCEEHGFTNTDLTGGTGIWSMHRLLKFMDVVHSLGKSVYLYNNGPGTTSFTPEYAVACFLLMNNGTDRFKLGYLDEWWTGWYAGYDVNLGDAITSWSRASNGLFSRTFTGGKVYALEPGAATVTITADADYTLIDGTQFKKGATRTLAAANGLVLIGATVVVGAPSNLTLPTLNVADPYVPDAPKGYWKLNEGSGSFADSSGFGHTGTPSGTITYGQPGVDGTNAITLGGGYFQVVDHADFDTGDTFSLEAWIDLTSAPVATNVIFDKGAGSYRLEIDTGNGKVFLWKLGTAAIARSLIAFPIDGNLHHLVVTKSGASTHIYIDGVDVTDMIGDQTIGNTAVNLFVGADNTGGQTLKARIDKVAVYATALSAARVTQHYLGTSAKVGSTITCSTGTWTNSPTAFSYQWQRDTRGNGVYASIAGATSNSYVLTDLDDKSHVRCVVTASNAAGTSSPATSAASATVLEPAPFNTSLPSMSGTPEVGKPLNISNGSWLNMGGYLPSFSYQWQISANGVSGWSNISGATANTYTPVATDQTKYVRAVVTATNSGGSTQANSIVSGQITGAPTPPPGPPPPIPGPVTSGNYVPAITYTVLVGWTPVQQASGTAIVGSALVDTATVGGTPFDYAFGPLDDVTSEVDSVVSIQRGRDDPLAPFQASTCSFSLRDPTGKYNPKNASSPLYGLIRPMRPVQVIAHFAGIDYRRYAGYIREISWRPQGRGGVATIDCVDLLAWMQRAFPVIPSTGPTTTGLAIGLILDSINWTSPLPRSLSDGDPIPDFSADGSVNALKLVENLLQTELGIFYVDPQGTPTYKDRQERAQASASVRTFTNVLTNLEPGLALDNVRNRASVAKAGSTPQTWEDAESILLYGPSDWGAIESPYLNGDTDALALAQYLVAIGKDPRAPVWQFTIDNRDDALANAMFGVDLIDRITVQEAQGNTDADFFVEGFTETIDKAAGLHTISMSLQERQQQNVAIVGKATVDGPDVVGF